MKRFLRLLLDSIALPTYVNAESIWLLVGYACGDLKNFEMINMNTCKIEAKKLKIAALFDPKMPMTYCIKGK